MGGGCLTVTLKLRPETEAGLLAHAQANGMTIEEYLQGVVEREIAAESVDAEDSGGSLEESGMIWENGVLIYGAGTALPAGFLEDALRRSREARLHQLCR